MCDRARKDCVNINEHITNRSLPTGTKVYKPNIDIGYKIFTKDDYIRYRLSGMQAYNIHVTTVDNIKEHWKKISKGYNFVVGVGQEDSLMFYSVEYFNTNIIGGKDEPKKVTVKIGLSTTEFKKELDNFKTRMLDI